MDVLEEAYKALRSGDEERACSLLEELMVGSTRMQVLEVMMHPRREELIELLILTAKTAGKPN
jgi:hypothetical protein